jgi:hypothetical protein
MPVNGKPNGLFELPQFTPLNFSLTDGTDIPPPPRSPIEEKPPPIAPKRDVLDQSVATATTNGTPIDLANGNAVYDGRARTNGVVQTSVSADPKAPMSPVSSTTRPSSIRRFLSRRSLNTHYENGTNTNVSHEDLMPVDRPESALSFASTKNMDKKSRPSWFRRFSSNSGTRTAVIYEEKRATIMPMGPPPPKLPELSKLGAKIPEDDEGSLGGADLFKNIK